MKIGLISDTHGYLPGKVFDLFADVECILHAGDIGDQQVLDELATIAPVHAVSGNMDSAPSAARPIIYSMDAHGIRICMTHGHLLNPADYGKSAIEIFSELKPRVIVHGHSHRAKQETFGDVLVINPGAACKPRFHDIPSVAILDISPDGEIVCTFHKL